MITHEKCRSCGGAFRDLLDLGEHPLPDFSQKEPNWTYAPLQLVQCGDCHLVQMRHTVEREHLFTNYWYRSGLSETMRAALKDIAVAAARYRVGEHISLDIGSNDGTLLSMLPGECIGFEPSSIGEGTGAIPKFFSAREYFALHEKKATVVTTIAMFYSVGDPESFVHDVAMVMDKKGVWVNQMNDLTALVENTAYDIIGHEHTCVWSLTALKPLLEKYGLEVFRVERNDLNGGSMRLFIQHQGFRAVEPTVAAQYQRESWLDIKGFIVAVSRSTLALHHLLRRLKADGLRTYIYGASTRGVTVVHAAQLDEVLVHGAVERDKAKVGHLFPGTRIPIVSESHARTADADYFLALPYSYLQQFIKRESQWLKGGGRFIVPVPEPRIL